MLALAVFGIKNGSINAAVELIILFLVVIWLALVYWTYADARRRIVRLPHDESDLRPAELPSQRRHRFIRYLVRVEEHGTSRRLSLSARHEEIEHGVEDGLTWMEVDCLWLQRVLGHSQLTPKGEPIT